MKQVLIVALLCVNAALLVALAFGADAPANAQAVGGRTDYSVCTGKINTNTEVVYILDTATRRIAVVRLDRATNRLQAVGRTELTRDFGKTETR